jgi:hypothetical protein
VWGEAFLGARSLQSLGEAGDLVTSAETYALIRHLYNAKQISFAKHAAPGTLASSVPRKRQLSTQFSLRMRGGVSTEPADTAPSAISTPAMQIDAIGAMLRNGVAYTQEGMAPIFICLIVVLSRHVRVRVFVYVVS